jgi:hypothetical protein
MTIKVTQTAVSASRNVEKILIPKYWKIVFLIVRNV